MMPVAMRKLGPIAMFAFAACHHPHDSGEDPMYGSPPPCDGTVGLVMELARVEPIDTPSFTPDDAGCPTNQRDPIIPQSTLRDGAKSSMEKGHFGDVVQQLVLLMSSSCSMDEIAAARGDLAEAESHSGEITFENAPPNFDAPEVLGASDLLLGPREIIHKAPIRFEPTLFLTAGHYTLWGPGPRVEVDVRPRQRIVMNVRAVAYACPR